VPGSLIDHVIIQEDLEFGERVRAYRIEGSVGGEWMTLGTGTAIGHKRIQPVPATPCSAVRLVVVDAVDTPRIGRFAAFATGEAPPPTWQDTAALWAEDDAGRWSGDALNVDLTAKIDAAALWRVRLVAPGDARVRIENAELLLGGSSQPQLLQRDGSHPDRLLLTITQLGQPITLRARVRGARSGVILLRRI
jgi:alpha-L-fucosidase